LIRLNSTFIICTKCLELGFFGEGEEFLDIRKLIENGEMEHVYQSLWKLNNWHIYGFEALLRVPNPKITNIEHVFIEAREQGVLYELDTMAIRGAVSCFPLKYIKHELLFINIFPSTLLHEHFEIFLQTLIDDFPLIRGKVVFEFSETIREEKNWESSLLKERIQMLKKHGFLFALDDVGKGVANLQKVMDFQPNFIKLDRYFAKDLSSSIEKQRMISTMQSYCQDHIGLVLEGIEKENDLATAKLLNVPFAQGYLLGRPGKITANLFGQLQTI